MLFSCFYGLSDQGSMLRAMEAFVVAVYPHNYFRKTALVRNIFDFLRKNSDPTDGDAAHFPLVRQIRQL